jgi:hypothetical protein
MKKCKNNSRFESDISVTLRIWSFHVVIPLLISFIT